jgi:RNA polymerase sigma-70 factor (ECF subfamily)
LSEGFVVFFSLVSYYYTLTQVLGYSYAEAADICGVRVGTIRSRVARARADLLEAQKAAAITGDDRQNPGSGSGHLRLA